MCKLPMSEGVMVPAFSNSASVEDWVQELIEEDPDTEVETSVIDPETQEIIIPAGETAREQEWWAERMRILKLLPRWSLT